MPINETPTRVDVLIVGAGFGGLRALDTMRERGHSSILLEAGDGVGGTWYWNRYPGARVDVESLEYSYSFRDDLQQDWSWSEKYASQPEVERYLNWVADRLELRPDIRFGRRVTSMEFDESTGIWRSVAAVGGDDEEIYESPNVVLATGFLSVPTFPVIPGLDNFRGELVHTGRWPEPGPVIEGRRVGVVGTGASGVQVIQECAGNAAHLFVFQRTANWCFPLRNKPMDPDYERFVKENYAEIRALEQEVRGPGMVLMDGRISRSEMRNAMDLGHAERISDFEWRWQAGGVHMGRSFVDLVRSEEANQELRTFLEGKIREIVEDQAIAEKLVPTHPPLSRRPPGESGYYAAFNRPDVELVDVREDPIAEIVAEGVRLASGAVREVDVLVFATGFDGGTGAALRIDIRGRDGVLLRDHWAGGARTVLGIMTSKFPNLFMLLGPQSPAFHFSPPTLADFQSNYVADLIESLADKGLTRIEPRADAETEWSEHVTSLYAATLIWKTDSWWLGSNIPGKPRQGLAYSGGFANYRNRAHEAQDGLNAFVTA
ncbi:NAD(P)/FAD-dependent oxidoreductase [Nocardia sp. NPDC005745]|uniref:flavin-containing monooxygenase n=1 Tax=Nocardia sp. NPDC005745 TaxID=3157061 RepID=UPI0033FA126E